MFMAEHGVYIIGHFFLVKKETRVHPNPCFQKQILRELTSRIEIKFRFLRGVVPGTAYLSLRENPSILPTSPPYAPGKIPPRHPPLFFTCHKYLHRLPSSQNSKIK